MAAPHQATVAPDQLRWRYAPLDAEVICCTAVLEAIRREAVDGLRCLSHGGLETGGILLGRRTDRCMEVLGALPINCEHKLGPLFILSTADEKALEAALRGDKRGLQPVGLYVSHSRRSFSVADSDAYVLDRHSPKLWQMAVVIMPSKAGTSRTGFFIRDSLERPFVCVHEVMLSPVEHPSAPPTTQTEIAPLTIDSTQAAQPNRRSGIHVFFARSQRYRRLSQWNIAVSIGLLLLVMFAGGMWVRARTSQTPAVPMHVTDLGAKLRIEWDPTQKAVRTASAGTLEIRDGGHKSVSIPITRSGLENGSVLYVPQSDNIEASLKLIHRNGPASESVIYFLNPSHVVNAPAEIVSPAPPVARVPAESPASVAPSDSPQPVAPPVSDQKKPARKAFRLPQDLPVTAIAQNVTVDMPDTPDVKVDPSPMPLTTTIAPIGVYLASPSRLVGPPGPPAIGTGHLIWTGSLRKNAVLSFSPEGASTGVLNGRLPGAPVKITVQPAELVDGGIAVYSRNPDRSGNAGQPNVWNGWNVVFHDWDPKRIAEADILEAPSPSNSWKRLVLRNGNRNASVVVVNWERLPTR